MHNKGTNVRTREMVRHHLPLQGCYHCEYRGDGHCHSEWLAVGSVKEHLAGDEDEDPLPQYPMNSTNTPDTASEDEPSSSSTPKTNVMILEEDASSLIAEEIRKSKVAMLSMEMYQVGMDVSDSFDDDEEQEDSIHTLSEATITNSSMEEKIPWPKKSRSKKRKLEDQVEDDTFEMDDTVKNFLMVTFSQKENLRNTIQRSRSPRRSGTSSIHIYA